LGHAKRKKAKSTHESAKESSQSAANKRQKELLGTVWSPGNATMLNSPPPDEDIMSLDQGIIDVEILINKRKQQ
jgi:hypothetical protein